MNRQWLRVIAPFAAYRPMQAGSLRATLPVMTYSAAWGLALNLAGIETRQHVNQTTTGIDPNAPSLRITIGIPHSLPNTSSLFQQGHSYPVGNSSKNLQERAKGAKYHIAPVRREILVNLDVVLGIEGESELLQRIQDGLTGKANWPRYGLPFAGDNNLLFDRIDLINSPPPCRWYTPVALAEKPRQGATRLSRSIDRADSSKTVNNLVAPQGDEEKTREPPESAWVWTPHEPVITP
jgi:CRISPR-associated protein Cas5t